MGAQALCSAALHLSYDSLLAELEGVVYQAEDLKGRTFDAEFSEAVDISERGAESYLRKRMLSSPFGNTSSSSPVSSPEHLLSSSAPSRRSSWTPRCLSCLLLLFPFPTVNFAFLRKEALEIHSALSFSGLCFPMSKYSGSSAPFRSFTSPYQCQVLHSRKRKILAPKVAVLSLTTSYQCQVLLS